MINYSPAYVRRFAVGQNGGAPAATPSVAVVPATVTTSYTGVPGFLETVVVLGASAAAAYTGIRAARNKSNNKTNRAAGWIGGIGAGLIGLLYLGGKTGITKSVSLPSVQVVA